MVNIFYFWISEETEERLFDYIITIESIFSIFFNSLAFLIFQLKPPLKNDACTNLLKWGRIIDIFIPFTFGIMLRSRTLVPLIGIAANGICHGSYYLCKASLTLQMTSIYPLFSYMFLSYIFRYNIFIRRNYVYYFSHFEKFILLNIWIILPITTIFMFQYYGREDFIYESGIRNFTLANFYLNRNKFTLIIYSEHLELPVYIFLIIYEVAFIFLNLYLIIAYTIPFENELKRCQKSTNKNVAKTIKYNIRFLRLYVSLPIILSLLPFTIGFFLSFVPSIRKINFYLNTRHSVLVMIYFCISPFLTLHHAYKGYSERNAERKIQQSTIAS
ncbi:Hypothetical protein SRAE_2000437700 [Strongyloides ratti]|uniref:Uncharacterized protein n=1 Tax=Strongyloides ratti TaxID=34506 RepID=A0A090MZY2_STRRB|nr:Hypothetical protein SRAE_2000437700 [Strongyloides ratti]CEF69730.1 Hypothetical protein SRAE_2000437700 [Strongyloides ratti]